MQKHSGNVGHCKRNKSKQGRRLLDRLTLGAQLFFGINLNFLNLVIVAILFLGASIFLFRNPKGNSRAEGMLVILVFAFAARIILSETIGLLPRLIHIRLDQFIYVFDASLGQPSFAMGRLLQQHGWLRYAAGLAYNTPYTVFLILAGLYYLTQSQASIREFLKTVLICLVLAPLEYAMFPVSGPVYAFPGFPSVAPTIGTPHVIILAAVPNGVPSIHMSLALIFWYFARKWKLGSVLGGVFTLFTVCATLGFGEHYLFDLLVAVPHTLLSIVCAREPQEFPEPEPSLQ